MRIGVICGDQWHPAGVVAAGMHELGLNEFDFDFITDTSDWSVDGLSRYDAVVLAKINCKSPSDPDPWLTTAVQEGFHSYIKSGGGLLVLHAGTVGYGDSPMFLNLVGGVFSHHPEPCAVLFDYVCDSRFTDPDPTDEVTDLEAPSISKAPLPALGRGRGRGLVAGEVMVDSGTHIDDNQSFELYDEHYFIDSLSGDAAVFMTSTSTHGVQPAGWTRLHGSGRVCVVTPGHFADVWHNADYQSLIEGALRWCTAAPTRGDLDGEQT